ncbi:MAG: DNA-directed RNA polymerase subunit beta', partial [Chloroflexi bacterium]
MIDNSQRGKAVSQRGQRKLKSLSDLLKGKQGRFRRNLLGKRVDYSGRSVIVVGPQLKLNQCGLPKQMALELFKPFVMRKLVENNFAHNIKSAKRLVDRMSPEVWDVLETIIKDHPVLLNRAPTLHRLGIQAFEVILVEGSAIQIHPLVCAAFNADFDGDQMAVHVPRRPANRLSNPPKIWCWAVTISRWTAPTNAAKVKFSRRRKKSRWHTSSASSNCTPKSNCNLARARKKNSSRRPSGASCVLFNEIFPEEMRFVNDVQDKKKLKELVARAYQVVGSEGTAEVVDRIKEIGFKYATRSGLTIAIDDITVPANKEEIIHNVEVSVAEVEKQYRRGLITEDEQYVKTVELWTEATEEITDAVAKSFAQDSPVRVMANSGATKGGFTPLRQLAGMRGLMADPAGRIIPLPITSNFREGLTALEYFISTHGARKGLADTALRTADAGYLTRRLVDVAQDVIINEDDCGTHSGIWLSGDSKERTGESFEERVVGRVAASAIANPKTGEIIVNALELITEQMFAQMKAAGVDRVFVRSPLTCGARHGLCAKCYGRDLARGGLIRIGEAVGVIAAQSIGEPGTQLTLRTFHTGGVAGAEDITTGLPRIEELFESRDPKGQSIISDIDGQVEIAIEDGQRVLEVVATKIETDDYEMPTHTKALVKEGEFAPTGTVLYQ